MVGIVIIRSCRRTVADVASGIVSHVDWANILADLPTEIEGLPH